MNCPVRTEPFPDEGHNQNPPELAAELTTRRSLNTPRGAIVTSRTDLTDGSHSPQEDTVQEPGEDHGIRVGASDNLRNRRGVVTDEKKKGEYRHTSKQGASMLHRTLSGRDDPSSSASLPTGDPPENGNRYIKFLLKIRHKAAKYLRFIGPGFMVSVAYIDPGNYATDVAAGATFRYRLLFMILLSNLIAIFLQSLCIKLGTVTGMNLAENCKAHLPKWLNYVLYVFAEAAIIATDIAEVIGSAIALNILLKIPLIAGCAISIVDVLVILFFYNPTGMSMRALRLFELFVIVLVLGVVICFCWELSKIRNTTIGEVFKGYLPSSVIVSSQGLYQSCGILGATVMPHSLYLGSGIVQNRLRDFDETYNGLPPVKKNLSFLSDDSESTMSVPYRPSLGAIKSCLNYSILELGLSLFTFALFVNSAILITAGASLSHLSKEEIDNADLFSIHELLASSIAPAAGTIFALALLLSGTSAGIVCTIAGQMVSEGQLSWTIRPWLRRLITRTISIIPSIIIAAAVGRRGLSEALEASQVALSVILPFVSAPLLYFTFSAKVMRVSVSNRPGGANVLNDLTADGEDAEHTADHEENIVVMKTSWYTNVVGVAAWLLITIMNVALLVLLGLGKH